MGRPLFGPFAAPFRPTIDLDGQFIGLDSHFATRELRTEKSIKPESDMKANDRVV